MYIDIYQYIFICQCIFSIYFYIVISICIFIARQRWWHCSCCPQVLHVVFTLPSVFLWKGWITPNRSRRSSGSGLAESFVSCSSSFKSGLLNCSVWSRCLIRFRMRTRWRESQEAAVSQGGSEKFSLSVKSRLISRFAFLIWNGKVVWSNDDSEPTLLSLRIEKHNCIPEKKHGFELLIVLLKPPFCSIIWCKPVSFFQKC